MPTSGAPSAAIQTAFNGDCPLFVSSNALNDTTNLTPRWTTGGSSSSTDMTVIGRPTSLAWDGLGEIGTYASGSFGTFYFNFELNAAAVDTFMIVMAATLETSTITVQLADNNTFTSGLVAIGIFTDVGGTCRRIATTLPSTTYTGVRYGRIRFVRSTGNYTNNPQIGEFVIGSARLLSRTWDFGSDMAPRYARAEPFVSRSGSVTMNPTSRGLRSFRHQYVASSSSLRGYNDVSTIRSIHTDCNDGTLAIAYVPQPSTALGDGYLGYIPLELELPRETFGAHYYDFAFDEVPPARSRDVCTTATTETLDRLIGYFGARGAPTGAGFQIDAWGPLTGLVSTGTGNVPTLATTSQVAGTPRQDNTGTTGTSGWRTSSTEGAVGLIGSGSAPGVGGFGPFPVRFNLFSDPGGWRALVGLQSGTALFDLLSQEPTALTTLAFVAVGFPSTDSAGGNFRIYHSSGGGTVTTIDTGIARNTTSVFQLVLQSERGSGTVEISIEDLVSGSIYSTTLSSNLPSTSTPLLFTTTSRHPSNTQVGITIEDCWLFDA